MKIKPCPCCGGVATVKIVGSEEDGYRADTIYISCCKCGLSTARWAWHKDNKALKFKIARAWNRRYKPPITLTKTIRRFIGEPNNSPTLARMHREIIQDHFKTRIGYEQAKSEIEFDIVATEDSVTISSKNDRTNKIFKHIPV